ncbi:MAG: glycoside hydrolase family 3 C-terminal domain-containing protein, partial [Egibacteraceae bacterium]
GGAPWTVMHAYNRLNGDYCGQSGWLLTSVLREEWGFDGLVMSDWGATSDRAAALAAGTDLEMPGSNGAFDPEVRAAMAEGRLSTADVARSATRVVALLLRAHAARQARGAPAEVDADAHHDLARRVAAAGTVLLANDGVLPLDLPALTARPGGLAVLGAFAAHPRYQGAGSSQVTPRRLTDARSALRARVDGDGLRYAPGYDPSSGATTPHLLAEAAEAAAAADVAVVVVGLPGAYESEGFDRQHLRLPEGHTALVEAVLAANPRTVVVLANGAPVELPWADRAAAILETNLGGQAGGEAIADVLAGEAEPGGRLAESIPVRAGDLPADAHFAAHPTQVEHREGLALGYRFHTTAGVPARFPFGHGLAYTSFGYGRLEVSGEGTDLEVAVRVTNTGARAGSEVVQLYVGAVAPPVPRPLRELAGFAKVHLEAGASATVRLPLDARAFAVWDVAAQDWRVASGAYELEVASSATDVRARARVDIVSEAEPGPSATPVAAAADDAGFAAALGRAVPTPAGPRPLDRDSTVADLAATRAGALVQRLLLATLRRRIAGDTGGDEATRRFYEAALLETPLRALVVLAGGRPPLRVLDALCALLDGRAPWRPVPRRR